jgi:valyl-tRNA synthetase
MLRSLAAVVEDATRSLDAYDYARVLQRTEEFFWRFCDDYLELVKGRRYGDQGEAGAASANSALGAALSVMLRLFAPYLPFVTEEVWSWWQEGSIHNAAWPSGDELQRLIVDNSEEALKADQQVYDWAIRVLFEVRKQRSESKQALKVPITQVTITAASGTDALMTHVEQDLKSALRVRQFLLAAGEPCQILVAGYDAPAAS